MLQLSRVGWRLLACENGASPDCIVVVGCWLLVAAVAVVVVVLLFLKRLKRGNVYVNKVLC